MTATALSMIVVLLPVLHPNHEPQPLSDAPVWDDGLSEMCYYDAVDRLYGEDRSYTRVHLFNRQWLDAESSVKAAPGDAGAVPVFKLNIAEEIPTENYNYRFLTTLFLRRPDLAPLKLVTSSQEWCGTTFKHLRFHDTGGTYKSFSYFAGEGDREWSLDAGAVPFESLFVIARDVAARNAVRELDVLASVRSNCEVKPNVRHARLVPGRTTQKRSRVGTHTVRRVEVDWDGPKTFFVVEAEAPYRIIRFEHGHLRGTLRNVERRAYWDRNSKSAAHEPNQAP